MIYTLDQATPLSVFLGAYENTDSIDFGEGDLIGFHIKESGSFEIMRKPVLNHNLFPQTIPNDHYHVLPIDEVVG